MMATTKPEIYRAAKATGVRYTATRRESSGERGYDYQWRRFRGWLINKDPERWLRCTECREYAADPSLIHLDHIQPLAAGGLKFSVPNLQPLCPGCHAVKTRGETLRGDTLRENPMAWGGGRV